MSFFNSLSIRIALAIVGAILYGLLSSYILTLLGLSYELSLPASIIVFLLYLLSRFVLLFTGIQTRYYSKGNGTSSRGLYENTSFYRTAQWVGTFYHYHDLALFAFLTLLAISLLISLGVDWWREVPPGTTARKFWDLRIPIYLLFFMPSVS